MNWISVRELLAIRRKVTAHAVLRRGVHNGAAVYSAIRRPFAAFAGHERFPSSAEKIAAMIHTIIAFHPFIEGNESTALVAADVVLRLNGSRLIPGPATEPYFRSIARGEQTVEQIAVWLAQNSAPATESQHRRGDAPHFSE